MNKRFYSLVKNGPKGFIYKKDLSSDELKAAEFALFAPDLSGFKKRFAPDLSRLTGVVVTWAPTMSVRALGPFLWHLAVPKGSPRLADLAASYFPFIRARIRDMESMDRLSTGCGGESERKYRYLYENAFEGIFVISREGRFMSANPAMVRILGYDSEEDLVSSLTDIVKQCCITSEDRAEVARLLAEEGQLIGYELQLARKDDTVVWVALSARAVRGCRGERLCYEGSLVDITERKERERAERERKAAEAANRAKSNFLAVMSHEIRTPMNAILGMADLLWESPLNPEQKQYVQTYRESCDHLMNLVNSILDMTKVESGRMELEEIPFDLEELADKTMESMAFEAHRKGLELVLDIQPDSPRRLVGDPARLRQILVNLLGNSIKFTHEGEVVLEIGPTSQAPLPGPGSIKGAGKKAEFQFTVRDTGIGIPEKQQANIFDAFVQEDSSITRRFGGSGLGLSISKSLINLMGGEVWLESSPGCGSVFGFTTKLGVAEPAIAASGPSGLKGARVLVVDDHPLSRRVLRGHLKSFGAIVLLAESGQQCIEIMAQTAQDKNPVDALVLDARMPGMDGLETLRQIRRRFIKPKPCVMLVTADDKSKAVARASWAGAQACLVKPVTGSRLKNALLQILVEQRVRAELAKVDADSRGPLRILLVEDNENNRMLFSFYLKKTEHEVVAARNGQEGVDEFMANDFDIVFMDIEMPVMDGYEATRRIRQWERQKGRRPSPIIALTANILEVREKSLEAGCDQHMTKPFRKNQLLEIIESAIR